MKKKIISGLITIIAITACTSNITGIRKFDNGFILEDEGRFLSYRNNKEIIHAFDSDNENPWEKIERKRYNGKWEFYYPNTEGFEKQQKRINLWAYKE